MRSIACRERAALASPLVLRRSCTRDGLLVQGATRFVRQVLEGFPRGG